VRDFVALGARNLPRRGEAPEIVIATPAGQVHEVGALLAAAASRGMGWRAIYLGASLPAKEIAACAQARKARAVGLSLEHPANDAEVLQELLNLRKLLHPETIMLIGGRAATAYPQAIETPGVTLVKGLTDFERLPNFMERWFHVDLNQRPPTQARRSFAAFQTVVEQYPNSDYAHDARRRMVYLRNRLADYEIAVAHYYIGRGAYVAAAQRAKVAIEEFDGAPAVREALEILILCYDKMELTELAAQTRTMYRANYEAEAGERKGSVNKKKWWKPWS